VWKRHALRLVRGLVVKVRRHLSFVFVGGYQVGFILGHLRFLNLRRDLDHSHRRLRDKITRLDVAGLWSLAEVSRNKKKPDPKGPALNKKQMSKTD
jgi:hypothetical protein